MTHPSSRFNRISPAVVLLLAGVALASGIYVLSPRWEDLPGRLAAIKDTTRFDQEPVYAGVFALNPGDTDLRPGALFFGHGLYYVSYEGSGRVDVLDRRFERVKTLQLSHGPDAGIAGLAADENRVYVSDALSGEIRIHETDGSVRNAFNWLPGKAGRLSPRGMSLYDDNLYVTDPGNRQLLVISVSDVAGLKEEGELLFAVPGPGGDTTLFSGPVSAAVTPDGRILVSDAGSGDIKAFTCNGRFAYRITPGGGMILRSPGPIAFDDLPNPALIERDRLSFDPSGIRGQGRMHVVDGAGHDVVILDATGAFVLRYGKSRLNRPVGIAIDRESRVVVIADAGIGGLVGFKY